METIHKNWPKQIQVVDCCNKTCKLHRIKNILEAPFSLQSKIKSSFYIYYLCFSKSRGAEVFKIRLASSLRSISHSCIFSPYTSYKDYLWELIPKYTRLETFRYFMIQQCSMHLSLKLNVLQLFQKVIYNSIIPCLWRFWPFFVCFWGFFCLFVFGFVCLFKKSISRRLPSQILSRIRFKFLTEQLSGLF